MFNFEEDIRRHILARLGRNENERREIADLSFDELLFQFTNWARRLIEPRPRSVKVSRALLSNPLAEDPNFILALQRISHLFETGGDLTPHLSNRVSTDRYQSPQVAPLPLTARRDLDLMLSDWNVHHLHLSCEVRSDGFVQRTKELLFVTVKVEAAYLIDIMRHRDWTRNHIIETIVENWPDDGLVRVLNGVVGLTFSISEDDRKAYRAHGISAPFELNGKVYSPIGPMTAAGTSGRAAMAVNQLLDDIEWLELELRKPVNCFLNECKRRGVIPPEEPEFHFLFFASGGYGFSEAHTGLEFRLQQ